VQCFGRKVRFIKKTWGCKKKGCIFWQRASDDGRDAHKTKTSSLSLPRSLFQPLQKSAVAVAYARPGKGLVKLNGEEETGRWRAEDGRPFLFLPSSCRAAKCSCLISVIISF
jgi:hypothetical protein